MSKNISLKSACGQEEVVQLDNASRGTGRHAHRWKLTVQTGQASGFDCVTLCVSLEVTIQKCSIIIAVIKILDPFWENVRGGISKIGEQMLETLLT